MPLFATREISTQYPKDFENAKGGVDRAEHNGGCSWVVQISRPRIRKILAFYRILLFPLAYFLFSA